MTVAIVVVMIAVSVLVAGMVLLTVTAEGWISHTVDIDAPLREVWEYGSDSTRAAEWSVYFHHITPETAPDRPADGEVGAFRRCFRDAEERGTRWDETTEAVDVLRQRTIRTFNLVGFPVWGLPRAQEYEVFQDYEELTPAHTRLTFRSRLVRPRGLAVLLAWPLVKTAYLVGTPAGQEMFVVNLENIKAAVEARHAGREYVRPHPYEAVLPFETAPLRWWIRNRVDRLTQHRSGGPQSPSRMHVTA